MSARIRELLLDLEAFHFKLDPDSNRYKAQVYIEDLNYLITSIVEKCADFIEEDQGSGKELSDRMKQHFRVE